MILGDRAVLAKIGLPETDGDLVPSCCGLALTVKRVLKHSWMGYLIDPLHVPFAAIADAGTEMRALALGRIEY